ncbi:MAG TPA: GNAT family N-acetyltransferase, partial [Candidatus Elarobacter sp.]|nr:GNAT family N-acetyltransferase [Candidatus Elarobacter sp.]
GAIIGLASVYVDLESIRFGRRCWLEDLVVTARRRSQGIGRRLLDAATTWARERGCTHLELNSAVTRTDAHRFYLASGMTQTSLNFGRELER